MNYYFPMRLRLDYSGAFALRLDCREIYEKILSGIQDTRSLPVTVASFRLLHDLDVVSIF